MRIYAKDVVASGRILDVFRTDTGEHLRWVRWFDPDMGVACCFRIDPRIAEAAELDPDKVSNIIRAPLRFTESRLARWQPKENNEAIPEELTRRRVTYERTVMEFGKVCQYPGCHRLACWAVSDLQDCPRTTGPDGKEYARSITIGVSMFCERSDHYRAPVRTSERGVQSQIEVEVARPQH